MDLSKVKLKKTETKEAKAPGVVLCADSEDYQRLMAETYIEQCIYMEALFTVFMFLFLLFMFLLLFLLFLLLFVVFVFFVVFFCFLFCFFCFFKQYKYIEIIKPWTFRSNFVPLSPEAIKAILAFHKDYIQDSSTRNNFSANEHLVKLAQQIDQVKLAMVCLPLSLKKHIK
jgi:hypothetical protein